MPTIKGVRQSGQQNGSLELGPDKLIRRYQLEYVVIADNSSQGSVAIRSASGLPKVGVTSYSYNGESDTGAVCKRKTATRDSKQPLLWLVRVEYNNDASSQSQVTEDNDGDATERPPIVEWDAEFADVVLYKDFSTPRKAVVNPVGHAFDPPATRRQIFPVLTIERYQETFAPATILAYTDHVNENEFYGADPGQALMTRIRAKQVVEDSIKLWQVVFRIRFAIGDDGHKQLPLNQGSHYKSGEQLKAFLKDNVPYVGNLNLDGTAAADGTRTFGGADGEGFKPYPEADFDDLNLE